MPSSLYDISVPVFIHSLEILKHILQKGEDYAKEKGIDPSTLLEAKLADDMFALPFQVQRVSDCAKGVPVRLGGVPNLPLKDDEKTFADLQGRVQKTIDFLKEAKPADFDGKEDKVVDFKFGKANLTYTGKEYILNYALPNFYFHVTATYLILRNKGVPVGKADFLAGAAGANVEV